MRIQCLQDKEEKLWSVTKSNLTIQPKTVSETIFTLPKGKYIVTLQMWGIPASLYNASAEIYLYINGVRNCSNFMYFRRDTDSLAGFLDCTSNSNVFTIYNNSSLTMTFNAYIFCIRVSK